MRHWLLFALLLFPVLSFASSQGGAFSVAPTDKSMEYLGMVLGAIPGTPIGQNDTTNVASPVIEQIFYVFNQIIFGVGILVIAYTAIVGTISTAQEGEFLGRQKWHPIIVPLRAAFGIYLLLPTMNGYNWVQIAVLWFIVQGVGAANALWKQVIYFNENSGSIRTDTRQLNLLLAGNTVNAIFNANVCAVALNKDPTALNLMGEPITAYRSMSGNRIEWGRRTKEGKEQPLCGSITIPKVGGGLFDKNSAAVFDRQNTLANAIIGAQLLLALPAYEALSASGSNNLGASSFVASASILTNAVKSLSSSFDSLDEINQQAIENGWILAGSYYFQIVQGAGPGISVNFSAKAANIDGIYNVVGASLGSSILESSNTAAETYATNSANAIEVPESETKLSLMSTGGNDEVSSLFSGLFGNLMENIVKGISKEMTQGDDKTRDPIVSMANFGAWLATTCEIMFWSVLATYFFIWLTSAVMHCMLPFGPAINQLLVIFVPIAMFFITMFYVAGITLALYIPMIPYLVFTFTAFGWLVLVIEALLGASLIGLSFVVPSEDELGKAGDTVVILLGLFLRPVLMILGFVFAVQLIFIAFTMLNFGFWSTLTANTGASSGVGVFGMVAVLLIYVGIATTFTHEAFSLIYVLPNKVLRWIGGGAEEDVAGQKTKELKGSVEKGGAIAKGSMTGLMGKAGEKAGSKK